MPAWKTFELAEPQMAQWGRERLTSAVAYLGTVRADGSPRVHPVTPIISDTHLFVFMEPTSPKGKDIERNGHFTLHCSVENNSGGQGEFYVRGKGRRVTDAATRKEAVDAAIYGPADRYILFILEVDFAFQNIYKDGQPDVKRWSAEV